MYVGALAFVAVALAVPGSFLWDALVWIGAMGLLILVVAAFVSFLFPPWLRRWFTEPTGRK